MSLYQQAFKGKTNFFLFLLFLKKNLIIYHFMPSKIVAGMVNDLTIGLLET